MNSNDLRQSYLDFFKGKGHTIKPSSSLIPDDASLLFTVAGMVPFKPQFLGTVKLDYTRAASCQKCIRTNDIDNVGRTYRHHTFFEMLGNFSFGDYFKDEAIAWSWEYLTSVLKLDKDRLHISVYRDDPEAIVIWKKIGVPESRIVKMGEESNFWNMGPTGPCGPCSEIYYDFGRQADPGVKEGDLDHGGNRYVEIWNNVFTQFDRQPDGKLLPLPKKNIDTGMGLERLAAVTQGVTSNFDTDLFQPVIQAAAEGVGARYGQDPRKDFSLRVIAEHLRASAFLVADGVLPSNEGRGYVLRRIFRRAATHGRQLGVKKLFLHELLPVVTSVMGKSYPELVEREAAITAALKGEEERFARTLDQGLGILKEMLAASGTKGQLSGSDAFKLYDTFGFPLELTSEVAKDQGVNVDVHEFESQLEAQRVRARAAWSGSAGADESVYGTMATKHGKTRFVGYAETESAAKVLGILKDGKAVPSAVEGDAVELILDSTPFYGESGGQVGDAGVLEGKGCELEVLDTLKRAGGDLFVHRCKVSVGTVTEGQELGARVDLSRRKAIARHHSATHLLHAALRKTLGPSVHQGGSLVGPDRLRFDFAYGHGLSDNEKESVERQVNAWAMANAASLIREIPIKDAKEEGAMALFGEKYGDKVRVVSFGDISKELCGGTHLGATGEIGSFRILSESSVSAGLRRIEAVAGEAAYEESHKDRLALAELAQRFKTSPAELPGRLEKLLEKEKELLRQIEKLKTSGSGFSVDSAVASAVVVKGVKLVSAELPEADEKTLKTYADQLRVKLGSGVVVLGSKNDEKATLVAA
ncbi:MAG: alanine--tRNA ligase, partial [candidate division FCPU426 bacterium]